MTKNIFNWNHISSNLTQDQITELKEYYQTYHRKCWAFKQAAKRFKKWKLLGDTLSVVFATGGIASAIATSGISLVAISTTSVIIQGWMKHKNLELKIQNCTYTVCLSELSTPIECNQRYDERRGFSTKYFTYNDEQYR